MLVMMMRMTMMMMMLMTVERWVYESTCTHLWVLHGFRYGGGGMWCTIWLLLWFYNQSPGKRLAIKTISACSRSTSLPFSMECTKLKWILKNLLTLNSPFFPLDSVNGVLMQLFILKILNDIVPLGKRGCVVSLLRNMKQCSDVHVSSCFH